MDLLVYDDDEKRYVPWKIAVAGVLLVALLTAVLTALLARQASGSQDDPVGGVGAPEPATAPSEGTPTPAASGAAGSRPSPECLAALLRADAALQQSLGVEQALADHTAIIDELLAERITAEQALDQTLPVLTDGATQRSRLEDAVAAYQDARADCPA